MRHESNRGGLIDLYRSMVLAREIDRVELRLVAQGLAHFHVSGGGHEGMAALAEFLGADDMLHLHYRDKALLLARGMTVEQMFLSLLARDGSHSAGRQMSAHFSARDLNVASMVGPVGNNALQAVGMAAALAARSDSAIAVCCVGDGTTQQGEFYEAVAEAARLPAPVLFVVENNRFAISTRTGGQAFYDVPDADAGRFMGIEMVRVDGADVPATAAVFESAVRAMRGDRRPRIVLVDCERLSDHTNADDQTVYRRPEELSAAAAADPVARLRLFLTDTGSEEHELAALETACRTEVEAAAQRAIFAPPPQAEPAAGRPSPSILVGRTEYRGRDDGRMLVMREAINAVLEHRLAGDDRVFLYGQDIEDPKGDVFGVTRGLSTRFPGRVRNAPLSEATIVGTAIGRAMAGRRPVAFLQFADFVPLAFNQIASELGSLSWRTAGGWEAPVILMVSCGGYKPGLGPFHAQTFESVLAHVPGIDVVMPSSAADAAGLLNAAFESGRPTVFLYPKACLNTPDRATSTDLAEQFVLPGRARHLSRGNDLTIVTWGNPVAQCLHSVETLEAHGFAADLIDLRSIAPWDSAAVIDSARRTGRLLVVHEDNVSVGFGAEVVATVAERAGVPIAVRRVARPDTYVPFNFGNQLDILPSYRRVLEAAGDLLDCDIEWAEAPVAGGLVAVTAIGSGPADDEVTLVELLVEVGARVEVGQLVAVVEATKAAVDVAATVGGVVAELPVQPGARLAVGQPLLLLEPEVGTALPLAETAEIIRRARLVHRRPALAAPVVARASATPIGIAHLSSVLGSRRVDNAELMVNWPDRAAAEIEALTGIRSRRWVGEGQTLPGMAHDVARQALDAAGLGIGDIDLVIATTGTPDRTTPSLASRVAAALAPDASRPSLAAYDINAACSGYLYALQQAHDFIAQQPGARVLVVTAEILSPLLDPADFGTAILFGDAATASIVGAADRLPAARLVLQRPLIAGRPEPGNLLSVPLPGDGFIGMDGKAVFSEAVRSMTRCLEDACANAGATVGDLDLLVPHQANQRIIEAVERRAGKPALSVIAELGNTSSSTIPLALLAAPRRRKLRLGLVAFGGGMTYAAAIGELTSV